MAPGHPAAHAALAAVARPEQAAAVVARPRRRRGGGPALRPRPPPPRCRGAARLLAVAASAASGQPAAGAGGVPLSACPARFRLPPRPTGTLDLNGAALPEACFNTTAASHHVFVIGDWGGVVAGPGKAPVPADHRAKQFVSHARPFVVGVDDRAQQRVARQMMLRAITSKPDYVLNVGDNFYWGGIRARCGQPAFQHDETGQWGPIFEDMYRGPGIDGIQWLGVLGNHDYGGFTFTMGWDQAIRYTWGGATSTGRWVTPAQYWTSKVHYPDFSVDYLFVDSNVFDTFAPDVQMAHNICGRKHSATRASCAPEGPASVCACPSWFAELWEAQLRWLEAQLAASSANWQIVVTHFPPNWGVGDWEVLARAHGIDLFVTGHVHRQLVLAADAPNNPLGGTPYLVSGGGGGITSEGVPSTSGEDDEYGFMELALSRDSITVRAISHGGQLRSTTTVHPRLPDTSLPAAAKRQPVPRDGCSLSSDAPSSHEARERRRAFLQWITGQRAEQKAA